MKSENTLDVGPQHNDAKTHNYFDNFTPSYKPERFQFACDFINEQNRSDARLLDIGCGDGATLAMIQHETKLTHLVGMDIAPNYLLKASEAVGCDTIEGSILDDSLVDSYAGQFDYCTLGAVIHHLIGANRRESTSLGQRCVVNAIKLLRTGGHLIIFEPTYTPEWAATVAFNIKRFCTKFTSSRVELFRHWANFGEPVVSYYTPDILRQFIVSAPANKILRFEELDNYRVGGVLNRHGMAVIVQRS